MKSSLGRIECYRLAEAGFLTLFLFQVRKRVFPPLKGLIYRTGSYRTPHYLNSSPSSQFFRIGQIYCEWPLGTIDLKKRYKSALKDRIGT
jgi:hypothetical protein